MMLVDLGRNDLGRVCEYGSVHVETLMEVERYSHVMHIVSSVAGTLREDVGAMDALRATLPAGTLSGAPKVRAMQIIDELEPVKRGGYGGAIGYLSYSGELDTAIHIRTVVVKDGVAHVQAGGGTVADAEPAKEFRESEAKAQRGAARDRARRPAASKGREAQSIAFLSWPGIDPLYSGVANSRPSAAAIASRQCSTASPGSSSSSSSNGGIAFSVSKRTYSTSSGSSREATARRRVLWESARRLPETPRMRMARYSCPTLRSSSSAISVTSLAATGMPPGSWAAKSTPNSVRSIVVESSMPTRGLPSGSAGL
jgi:hypothetical protein